MQGLIVIRNHLLSHVIEKGGGGECRKSIAVSITENKNKFESEFTHIVSHFSLERSGKQMPKQNREQFITIYLTYPVGTTAYCGSQYQWTRQCQMCFFDIDELIENAAYFDLY